MRLNELSPVPGSNKKFKRVGRGLGSGKGKTCGRGVKGQKSRTGVAIHGFEGGQMPIHRRLPKRGFKSLDKVSYRIVNIGELNYLLDQNIITGSDEVNHELLVRVGLIKNTNQLVKVLGEGELNKGLTFNLDAYSQSAISMIEQAGGKIINK